ncbi:ArsR/SmtB family transcription factor [Dermatobacter hominis]|uniref:ArsR/SmtB family transcription factor n=1 Tax=Dermatobacter hominis TaxID=2884263 RepID=UPI001D113964|nr:metalloregulator ArsR/SmtB family transcription factor [Dermatobacter hominis]UDY37772.1 metalloregulator ArsR/SmtB family transcription factor [Dermatobacter hominis]
MATSDRGAPTGTDPGPDVFGALANPVRRRILELLADGPRNAGAIAGEFELSRPAVSEHLAVLRRAELVTEEVRGRERHYALAAGPLAELDDWLRPFERYWRHTLRGLRDHVEATAPPITPSTGDDQ